MRDIGYYFVIVIVCILIGVFVFAGVKAMDEYFDNQDRMLRNSAKVSGNEIYLDRCICFYNGENIRCIYKEESYGRSN